MVFRSVEDGKRVMVLDWMHRWKKGYIRNVRKRFKVIADLCESYNFIHIVLTVGHFGDIGYNMRSLKRAWKLLHDLLTKRYGKFIIVKEKKEKRWELWFTCEIDELEYLLNLAGSIRTESKMRS